MTSNSIDIQSAPYTTTKTVTISSSSTSDLLGNYLTYTIPRTFTVSGGYYGSLFVDNREREYKCPYCDTVYNYRTGKCENCGAPLGEAIEI